jgi:cytochrome P450
MLYFNRQVASHMFTTKELKSYVAIYRKHALEVLEILKKAQSKGETIDIQNLFSRCTLDSIGEIAFGKDIKSLHHEGTFSAAFNLAQTAVDGRIFTPLWKYLKFVKCEKDMTSSVVVLDDFIYGLIKERREDPNLSECNDLLSRYLQLTDENGEAFSDKYIRDIVINIMIAGRDTTAQTLTWTHYLLSQNERVLNKLREEITRELGDQEPTYDNVRNIKYLQAVIDETLRMYPPVSIDPKTAVEDDVLPGGFVVKKGMTVQWNQWVMGRHPDFWENPLELRPERWLEEGKNGDKPVPKANQPPFIPFQYGPRTCLGIQFAYLEVKVILCTLLQNGIRMECQPSPPVLPHSAITLCAANGIPMKIGGF